MSKKNKFIKSGFTLVEIMIVVGIIGILAGVVLVSSGSGVEKSKKASAMTTMASILPELVTCADDNGFGIKTVAPTTSAFICCKTAAGSVAACDTTGVDNADGHSEKWPDINTKTGYTYQPPTGSLSAGDYQYTATKTVDSVTETITCSYSENGCN
jgi:prepilin-type N-terminal cleavage/methylation domain-containing protein